MYIFVHEYIDIIDHFLILYLRIRRVMILTITSSTLPSTTFPIPKNKVAKHTKDAETKEIGLRTFRGFIIASERRTEDILKML